MARLASNSAAKSAPPAEAEGARLLSAEESTRIGATEGGPTLYGDVFAVEGGAPEGEAPQHDPPAIALMPAPPIDDDPAQLMGLDPRGLEQRLGTPSLQRREPPAEEITKSECAYACGISSMKLSTSAASPSWR